MHIHTSKVDLKFTALYPLTWISRVWSMDPEDFVIINTFDKFYHHNYHLSVLWKRWENLYQCLIIASAWDLHKSWKIPILSIPSPESLLPVLFLRCSCRILLISIFFSMAQKFDILSVDCMNKFTKYRFLLDISVLKHSHTMTPFDTPGKQAFWKHCGKRRNRLWQAISPFPTVFSTCSDYFLPFSSNLKLSSANSFSLEESKICRPVMG